MPKRHIVILLIAALLIPASVFAAGKLFLNGVDITGVKGKSFKKVKVVRIDDKGDIHLDAPQYEVKVMETGGKAAAPSKGDDNAAGLASQYYLATKGNGKRVQYDLVVKINGVERVFIKAEDSATIEEITGWLQKGKNTIHVTARKRLGSGRLSTSKDDNLTLMFGKGHVEKKVVKIDSLLATFKCDASKLSDFTKEYTITVK